MNQGNEFIHIGVKKDIFGHHFIALGLLYMSQTI